MAIRPRWTRYDVRQSAANLQRQDDTVFKETASSSVGRRLADKAHQRVAEVIDATGEMPSAHLRDDGLNHRMISCRRYVTIV